MTPISVFGPPIKLIKRIPAGFWLLAAMAAYTWRLTLFGHRTVTNGDALHFGLPLFDLRYRLLFEHASALWQNTLYGGHPLFAEGQGSFASPVPMILAAVISPIFGTVYTANVLRFVCTILTGIGMMGLTRSMGASRGAATFAALAVAFAPMWLEIKPNAVLDVSFMAVPWILWGLEVWLKRPSIGTATMLALAAANLIVAGYPQAPHGALIYMVCTLIPAPFYGAVRRHWIAHWRIWLSTGALALCLTLGLAAVQLLPLAELVGESHRAGGTQLFFAVSPQFFLRGMFYSLHTVYVDKDSLTVPNAGSMLVCILASLAVVFNKSSPRVVGHLIATLVLIQLAFGLGWPPFVFVYDHHLIFGLHYLRVVGFYMTIGIVGLAVLAAFGIDGLARYFGMPAGGADWTPPGPKRAFWGVIALTIAWFVGLWNLPTNVAPPLQFALVAAGAIGIAVLGFVGRARHIPLLFVVLLTIECFALRLPTLRFTSDELTRMPGSVTAIQAVPGWQDYKTIDASLAATSIFLDPADPLFVHGARWMQESITGSASLRWGLLGLDGSLALPMARRTKLQPLFADEISGATQVPPGLRFIDLLSIRFIGADNVLETPALREFWHSDGGTVIMENTAALPRFQVYSDHVAVDDQDAAIDMIKGWKHRTLVIENPPGKGHQTEMADSGDANDSARPPMTFTVRKAESTAYLVDLDATKPAWFFLADANYPGWTATLDGQRVPLFSAQVLGKAVGIPAGHHTLAIIFHSASFTRGLWISIVATVLSAIALLYDRRRKVPAGGVRSSS